MTFVINFEIRGRFELAALQQNINTLLRTYCTHTFQNYQPVPAMRSGYVWEHS